MTFMIITNYSCMKRMVLYLIGSEEGICTKYYFQWCDGIWFMVLLRTVWISGHYSARISNSYNICLVELVGDSFQAVLRSFSKIDYMENLNYGIPSDPWRLSYHVFLQIRGTIGHENLEQDIPRVLLLC